MASSLVEEQVKRLPESPGVYIMKDAHGSILYVGKAAVLPHRVRSYFSGGANLSPKIQRMVEQVADLEFFVTSSEQEALILELNLIKQFHPPYNVRLKDDKTFPYIKISINEAWPRAYMTRRLEQDGARYFGPFASVKSLRQTLKVLKGIFPFRYCTRPIDGTDTRACLEYHMGRCLAPCTGMVTREEYAEVVKEVILFLEGRHEKIVHELKKRMDKAAETLDFERAARTRDQIEAINSIVEGQRIAATLRGDQDAIAFAQSRDQAYVQVFFVRNNKLVGRESFVLHGTQHEEPAQIMTNFVKQYYSSNPNVPPLLLLQYPVEETDVVKAWLSGKRGGRVNIMVPSRGPKKGLIDLVAENARQGLEHLKIKQFALPKAADVALAELQKELNLPRPPVRIEGYDISNIQGTSAVGSMVVFEDGRPKSAHYRRFKIKTVAGADDFAMMAEVVRRRFKRSAEATGTWAIMPNLVLIDGGKGQLNAAHEAMKEAGVESVPVASLAKENEEIYRPGESKPIVLPRNSPGLHLVQRVRDEAHRFAIGYYRKVHKRGAFESVLSSVPGVGPKRRRALLTKFGSVQAIREASAEELAATKGMTVSLAKKVKELIGAS